MSVIYGNPITLGGGKKSRLPEGYTELPYIKSTGTQYIDTGFKPNQNTRVVIDFENEGDYSSMTTGLCPLFGARNASAAASAAAFALWVGEKSYPHYGNVAYNANGNFTVDINARLIYDMNKNVVSIGGQSITCTGATFTTNHNLYLLTINNYGTAESRRASGKLFSTKVYDNETLARDYIPCFNDNGEVGMYDIVNGAFYGNAGSGDFYIPFNVDTAPVLVWTNAQIGVESATFAAQTLTFGSDHYGFLVEAAISSKNDEMIGESFWGYRSTFFFPIGADDGFKGMYQNFNRSTSRGYGRGVGEVTANSIEFYNAEYNDNVNNVYLVPTRIWGVKFTL